MTSSGTWPVSADDLKHPRWRFWATRAAWIVAFLAVYFGVRAYQQRTLVQGPAPTLQAQLLDGSRLDLASLRGKPVLVYFWATWCPVCRLEQGSIESVAADYQVVGVAMQSGPDTEVRKYMQEHGLRVAVVNDQDGATAAVWGVRATPTSFVIDGSGGIRFRETGYTSEIGLRLRLWAAR